MNSKSKLSRFTCKDLKTKKKDNTSTETEVPEEKTTRDDVEDERLSPFFMRCTQDSGDDELDVIWDWESPRSKNNRSVFRKRILHSSPKIPRKHTPNNRNLPRFNSLKAELEQLANKLQTQEANLFETEDIFVKPKPLAESTDVDPFKDDSLDEELFKCSQKVEEAHNLNTWCSSIMNNNKDSKFIDAKIQDDSFDIFLEEIKEEDMEKLSQASSSNSLSPIIFKSNIAVSSPRSISRTVSVPAFSKPSTVTSSLVNRTKSEDTGMSEKIQCSSEEIERKRQEAKAKLEFKKRQNEIEKKRLEALERLAKKRMQKMSQNLKMQR